MSILLYRNYFYRSSVSVAEGHFGALVVLSGIGYACAALVTPPMTRRLSKPAWITLLLAASAAVTLALGETFSQAALPGHRVLPVPHPAERGDLRGHDLAGRGG